jgi:selenocysteine lyase/cysteine desulfurase
LKEFSRMVYLDSGSLGRSPEIVAKAQADWIKLRNRSGPAGGFMMKVIEGGLTLVPELKKDYPGLANWFGIERLREKVARVLGCEKDEIVFTQNTTDAIKTALLSMKLTGNDEILTTDLEHDSTLYNCAWACSQWKTKIEQVTLSDIVDTSDFASEAARRVEEAINKRTRTVILSHIAYGSGAILPVSDIVQACRAKNPPTLILVDGAHSLGLMPLSMNDLMCDFFASSGTKWLLAPEGTGILYTRKQLLREANRQFPVWPFMAYQVSDADYVSCQKWLGTIDEPFLFNACGEPRPLELGTANLTSLIGLDCALNKYIRIGALTVAERLTTLSDLAKTLLQNIDGVELMFMSNRAVAQGIVCFRIAHLVSYKDLCDVVSTLEREHGVICRAIPRPPCIRLSIHYRNTQTDVKRMARAVKEVALRWTTNRLAH